MDTRKLIGTLISILTAIYIIPIASLHNLPNDYGNRIMNIFIPMIIIMSCLITLIYICYKNSFYTLYIMSCIQFIAVFNSFINYWGTTSEIKTKAMDNNHKLEPSFSYIAYSGLFHIVFIFIGLTMMTISS